VTDELDMQALPPKKIEPLPLALDLVERTALAIFFSAMVWSFSRSWYETGNVISLMLIGSEGTVVAFLLIRRFTSEISLRPMDWIVALLGTTAPLLVRPTDNEPLVSIFYVCVPLMLAGFTLQIAAKLILARSFGVVPANRGVKVDGPYRILRHPMYAGYLLTQIAYVLNDPSFWNASVYSVALGLQISRILAEERVLNCDPAYREFALAVPYRLAPGIF
jgi:protein-S-isoprenylcysteine O-methyltransferase Ste14